MKDDSGFSTFTPTDWKTIPVNITVGAYGVDTIEAAPVQQPKPTTTQAHTPVNDDDIPF